MLAGWFRVGRASLKSPDMDLLAKYEPDSAQRIIDISAHIKAHYMHASCERRWKLGAGGDVASLQYGDVVDVLGS